MYDRVKASYVVGQLEKGKEGTIHLQFLVYTQRKVRASAFKKLDHRLHIEVCRNARDASKYCKKEETRIQGPWEFGVEPQWNQDRREKFAVAKQQAINREFDQIDPALYVRYCKSFHYIADQHQTLDKVTAENRGIWIYGESGTGKTSKVQADFGQLLYRKGREKWWDGYKDQKVVVLEDADPDNVKHLKDYLKDWMDRHPFKA